MCAMRIVNMGICAAWAALACRCSRWHVQGSGLDQVTSSPRTRWLIGLACGVIHATVVRFSVLSIFLIELIACV
jgi:hypothetical protein